MIEISKLLGIEFIKRNAYHAIVKVLGTELKLPIFAFQNYISENKRMRIIVKDDSTDCYILYVIGTADQMIPILNLAKSELLDLKENLSMKCMIGKIPKILGMKILSLDEIDRFDHSYHNAKISPVNYEGRIEMTFEEIEKNLVFLGIVGLHQPISSETKQTIDLLSRSGVKI